MNKGRIFDLSPGVVGQVRKTLIRRVLKQKEGPHMTSIGRSVILVAGAQEFPETQGCCIIERLSGRAYHSSSDLC